MAKNKLKRQWSHTPDEMLDLAVQKCVELGRVPSRRAWQKDSFFDFEELVDLLGKGDWRRADLKIALAYDQRCRGAQKAQEAQIMQAEPEMKLEESPVVEVAEPTEPEQAVPEPLAVEPPVVDTSARRRQKHHYTDDELRASILRIQEYFGITKMPGQVQINTAAREIGTPGYQVFSKRWGAKSQWGVVSGLEMGKSNAE